MSGLTARIVDEPSIGTGILRIGGVDAITPEVLVEVSDLCLERYRACDDHNKLLWHVYHENTANLVNHDQCPDSGVKVLGNMMTEDVRVPMEGESVVVRKGALVKSYHPSERGRPKVSAGQRVRVNHIIGGFIDPYEGYRVVSPEVRWVGSGGYWRWAALEDIEFA